MNYKSAPISLLPGFLQGVSRVIISYPFDYIRIHLQKKISKSAYAVLQTNNYNILNLYKGVKYPITIIPIDRAITFKLFEDFNKKYNPVISSLIVSSISCLYNVPLQSINTNYILENKSIPYFMFIKELMFKYKSNFLFKSYSIEYIRLVLSTTLYMGIYGNIRKIMPDNPKFYALNGIISNLITWSILYPLDTIRVEHQSNNMKLFSTIRNKYLNHGLRSFYAGIWLVYIRTIPSAGIGMLVYENVRKMIDFIE